MSQKTNNQAGVTILIAILILASIVILTVAISDLVVRASHSSKEIGFSEIAYFAAEVATEKALYQAEHLRSISGLDGASGNLDEINGASWQRQVDEVTQITIDCDNLGAQQGVCVENAGEITASNPLKVKLNAGKSFQLDLDFAGLGLPNSLQISWFGLGKVIAFGSNSQIISESSPVNLNDLSANAYLVRLINTGASLATFELKPAGNALPIGILLTSTGSYKNQQRILEIERTNWQIY